MNSSYKMIGQSSAIRVIVMAMAVMILMLTGCATFRPMPTHGGGKRFDEEQRLVSATIQHATQKMDFARFRKSRVAIEVTSLPTSGGAEEVHYGNLKSVYGYHLNPKLHSKKNITRQDVEYLEKALAQRLRLDGYQVTSPKDAEIYLVVLVDSLGTNHNRTDYGILFRDQLAVSCEMTYYAINAKTQKMISSARSVASIGDYCEINVRFSPLSFNTRTLTDFSETIVPLPVTRYLVTANYGDAHVEDLQFKIKQPKKGKKGKKGGFRGKGPKFNLPTKRDENGPDNELLPPPMAKPKAKAGGAPRQEKMKALIKQGYTEARAKDAEALQKTIKEIREIKPTAPVIEKLELKLKGLKGDGKQGDDPASSLLNASIHLGPVRYYKTDYIHDNWWREPEFLELPSFCLFKDIGQPLTNNNTSHQISDEIGYLDLPRR